MRKHILYIILAGFCLVSCSDWTKTESIGVDYRYPWEREPALWEEYFENVRQYKDSKHFTVLARFDNGVTPQTSEKNRMRSLPDSLDIVVLTNPDNFSAYDKEDMAWMRKVGTKVLYQIDLKGRAEELSSGSALTEALDKAISSVEENNLDGWSVTGQYRLDDETAITMASTVMSRLTSVKSDGKLIVFEGDPLFVQEADRDKVDFYALDTRDTDNTFDLGMQVGAAETDAGIPASKILLDAEYGSTIEVESQDEVDVLTELPARVFSLGPLGGLAVDGIAGDYYHSGGNYNTVRSAIKTLNP